MGHSHSVCHLLGPLSSITLKIKVLIYQLLHYKLNYCFLAVFSSYRFRFSIQVNRRGFVWWLIKVSLCYIVSWKLDALRAKLGISGATLRRHLNFWSNQGILQEHPADTFTVIESQEDSSSGPSNSHGVFGLWPLLFCYSMFFVSVPSVFNLTVLLLSVF